jgi:hypothetical protein
VSDRRAAPLRSFSRNWIKSTPPDDQPSTRLRRGGVAPLRSVMAHSCIEYANRRSCCSGFLSKLVDAASVMRRSLRNAARGDERRAGSRKSRVLFRGFVQVSQIRN